MYLKEDNVIERFRKSRMLYRKGGIIKAETGWWVYLNPKNWGVSRYDTDDNGNLRSFNLAFGAAKDDKEAEFLWNGKRYNTKYKHTPTTIPNFSGIITTRGRSYNPDDIAYINKGLISINPLQRAAILANIIEESGGDPLVTGPGGFYGLLQWGPERYTAKSSNRKQELDNLIKHILDTLHNTTDKMSWHHGGEGSGYNSAQAAHDAFMSNAPVEDINWAYTLGYVRPKGKAQSARNRSKVAQQIYQIIK